MKMIEKTTTYNYCICPNKTKRFLIRIILTRTLRRYNYIQSFYCALYVFAPKSHLQMIHRGCRFWSNALNMHIFLLSGPRSVRTDILFSNSLHFRFQRFFQPSFWPKVDDGESWTAIPYLVKRYTTCIPIFKKIGSKLRPWQCYHFFDKIWRSWRHQLC